MRVDVAENHIAEAFAIVLKGEPADLAAFYRQARAEGIFWSDAFGGYVAARYDDVLRVLTAEDEFGPLMGGSGSSMIHGRTVLHMDGAEHRRKSAILAKALRNPRLLDGPQREFVLALGIELVDRIPSDDLVDLRAAFTTPLPLQVTAWIMGIDEAPNFRDTYDQIVAGGVSNVAGDPDVHARAVAARTELFAFVTPLIEARRNDPHDDLLSTLCTAEVEGERLSDDEIRSFCSFLLAAGVETTDRALSSLLKHLLTHPDLWQRLRDDRSLVNAACVEGLRWAPPVHAIARSAKVDVELAGQLIRAGEKVMVLLASANRDETHFTDADDFVVDRFATTGGGDERHYSARTELLSFGHGRHLCTGSLLARLEMIEGMNLLLDRFEGAAFPEGVPDDRGYVLRSPPSLPVRLDPG